MKNANTNKTLNIALASLLILALAGTAKADDTRSGISGVIACGANQLVRNSGSEFHKTTFVLRNYNESAGISIDRIRVFNAAGTLLQDYDASSFPVFTNNILSSQDNLLDSYQSAHLSTRELLGDQGIDENQRPLQVIFDWSANFSVRPPSIASVSTVRERILNVDALGNVVLKEGAERSRHRSDCATLVLRKP